MYLSKRNGVVYESMGDDSVPAPAPAPATTPPDFNLRDTLNGPTFSTGAAIALTYHGYRRTNSLLWALFYGAMGKWFPIEAVPISIAQGFGQKKACP